MNQSHGQKHDGNTTQLFKALETSFDSLENISSKKALVHAKKMLQYSIKQNNDIYKIKSYLKLGVAYENLAKSDSALYSYDNALDLSRSIDNDTLFGFSVVQMSQLNTSRGNQDKVVTLILEALKKINQEQNHNLTYELYFKLSEVYRELDNHSKAEHYLKIIINNSKENNILAAAYNSLGLIHYRNNDFEKAEYNLLRSLDIFKIVKDNYNSCNTLSNLGAIYYQTGDYKKTKQYWIEAKEIAKSSNYQNLLSGILSNLSVIATKEKNYDEKLEYLKEAEQIVEKTKNYLNRSNVANNLALAYAEKGDIKNFRIYAGRFVRAMDSFYNIERNKKILEIEAKYSLEKKEAEIAHQKEIVTQQKKQKLLIIMGSILLTILLGAIAFLYRQRLFNQQALLQKQEELNHQEIAKLLEEQKLETLKAQLNGQNKERERIAKDLHDSISGDLAAIKLQLSRLEEQTTEVQLLADRLDQTYHEVRSISHDLVPKEININTFTGLIHQLIDFKTIDGTKINSEFFPREELDKLSEKNQVEIYRIVQELLTNINKHADANEVYVNLTQHENYINIMVEDNGQGFDTTKNKDGIGLRNIRSRLEGLKGELEITSSPGQGVIVNINIPME
ncbi:sensor histidine kinase [Aquimarina mytili]|uniref:histidine kinase n=2 Tax=Aquimarina mytili TaxID=874423 RepID=A0A936ZWT1_9FLAO|nr:sensor histidine kinase [Aquimarina mytili]